MSTTHSFSQPTPSSRSRARLFQAIPLVICIVTLAGFILILLREEPTSLSAYLTGLAFLACGIIVYTQRSHNAASQVYTFLVAMYAMGMLAFGQSDLPWPTSIIPGTAMALAGGGTIHLALIYPGNEFTTRRYPILPWIGYLPGCALLLYMLSQGPYPQSSGQIQVAELFGLGYAILGLGIFAIAAVASWRRTPSPFIALQARNLVFAGVISIAALLTVLVTSITNQAQPYSDWILALTIFPVVTGYTLTRYRLSPYSPLTPRLVVYSLLTISIILGYLAIAIGISLLLGRSIPAYNPIVTGLVVAVAIIIILPLRDFLQRQVNRLFLRGQAAFQEQIQEFTQETANTQDTDAIIQRLRGDIYAHLQPALLHIYIYDAERNLFLPSADEDGNPTTSLRFSAQCALAKQLFTSTKPVSLADGQPVPADLSREREQINLLGTRLFIPLAGTNYLIGWLALGEKTNGGSYTGTELAYLTALGNQASLGIERAQVIDNLKRRVKEMDVLARLSHGLNVTLAFDDILELIYAQTNNLVPTQNFRVTLKDQHSGETFHAFFLEDDERLPDRENTPLSSDHGLEKIVIDDRRVINVEDYRQECRQRSVIPDAPGVFAWIGIPLNAGDNTVGSLSVGNHEPAQPFSQRQVELLTAIADHTAGAITKIQLLEETERRARQLATLNEVGRGLSSTLEISPLLNQILDSAVEILDSEAGSLFLQDEDTGELVFEVTAGPVAKDLVGKRLAAGTGFVGQAMETGKPIVANEVRTSPDWFAAADMETGFVTRDLLVVPMNVKGRAIGVIEVINKRDGSPFKLEDQNLLATFASQAAVAIDNARLYTQTDEALTARLEEMAVMQRIDRELSASLDLQRVLEITLDWSIRQLKAEAGFIGLVEEGRDQDTGKIQIEVVRQASENADLLEHEITLDASYHPILLEAISDGQPRLVNNGSIFELEKYKEHGAGDSGATPQVNRCGLFVPIRRKNQTIGMLALESTSTAGFDQELVRFLSRLCDHAAIAISNAQLYADLQAANLAKSEFVSLVSHELKTPMTSIKGYADLLAQGTVGPVNEIQSNFLNTIRSNVNRMATLVSDLADVSRIEANRMRLEFSAVDLSAIAAEVVRSSQAQIDEKEQRIEIDIPAELPPAWCDQNRLIQILTNLISNAIKYTPNQGSICLSAALIHNRAESQRAADMIEVRVKDSGYGISEADQRKIFQKFFRSEDDRVREAPGTGLGLNITRHLVEMQGGRIWFESQLEEGSTFHFTIPPTHM